MTDFNPKKGEIILVSKPGLEGGCEQEFVVKIGGRYYCKTGDHRDLYLLAWFDAKPLPTKPEPIPYNHETWPKQVVWIKYTNTPQHPAIVTGFTDIGIISGGSSYGFKRMKTENVISLDFCQTWQPCHYVPE